MSRLVLLLIPVAAFAVAFLPAADAQEKTDRVFEMRTYWAPEGKLDDLNARFRDHTVKLFEKHGMTNVGYWLPIDNKDNKLVYLLSFPNMEARTRAFAAFGADPDWQKASRESEANGRLLAKGPESTFLTATDYSSEIKSTSTGGRVFELRTYTATPGKLDNLNARFREHTLKLFEKHGMTNVGYWTPVKGQRGKNDDTLIYLLAHKSEDAAKASWAAFRADPDWVAARQASETKAGGSLTSRTASSPSSSSRPTIRR